MRLVIASLLLASAAAGCGSVQDDDVEALATSFAAALSEHDGAVACSLLAPATRSELEQSTGEPCSRAVLDEATTPSGKLVRVEAFGTMAQVRFEQDTVFLTRFHSGWRVLAASCEEPSSPGPYDCSVQGG